MTAREEEIAQKTLQIFKSHLNPRRVILFGSRAKGKAAPASDFDWAVDCPPVDAAHKRRISEAIEQISGLYKTDVVYLTEVDEDFRQIILLTGKVCYEKGT